MILPATANPCIIAGRTRLDWIAGCADGKWLAPAAGIVFLAGQYPETVTITEGKCDGAGWYHRNCSRHRFDRISYPVSHDLLRSSELREAHIVCDCSSHFRSHRHFATPSQHQPGCVRYRTLFLTGFMRGCLRTRTSRRQFLRHPLAARDEPATGLFSNTRVRFNSSQSRLERATPVGSLRLGLLFIGGVDPSGQLSGDRGFSRRSVFSLSLYAPARRQQMSRSRAMRFTAGSSDPILCALSAMFSLSCSPLSISAGDRR